MATWLITGCSAGLGRALAPAVLDRGETAAVTARDPASVQDLARAYPRTALALPLDVTDHAQGRDAVRAARERFGTVDVLVNNAGHGCPREAISDYAATVGARRSEDPAEDTRQPGDPARAAQASAPASPAEEHRARQHPAGT
jgi:NADP-dependent 3-hydroxy acid dehydrogenase YdfG